MGGAIRHFGAARRGNQIRPILSAGLDVGRSCLRLVKALIKESQYNLLFASAVIVVTGSVACNSARPESPTGPPSSPSSTPRTTDPTPNIPATISAAVEATITASARTSGKPSPNPAQKTAPTPDIQAMIAEAVESAMAGLPTAAPQPPSATPTPDIQAMIAKAVKSAMAGLPTAAPQPSLPPAAVNPESPTPSPLKSPTNPVTSVNPGPPNTTTSSPTVPTPTPTISSTTTPVLPRPTTTPIPPAVSSTFASTVFDPASVTLSSIGASVPVTLKTSNLELDVDGVQMYIQHDDSLEVSSPVCTGIFQGATILPTVKMHGGTLIGCFFLSRNVDSTEGSVITFQLTRVGNFSQDQVLTLGLEGSTGSQFSDAGSPVPPGQTSQLVIKP